jgi:hypothetical protein
MARRSSRAASPAPAQRTGGLLIASRHGFPDRPTPRVADPADRSPFTGGGGLTLPLCGDSGWALPAI